MNCLTFYIVNFFMLWGNLVYGLLTDNFFKGKVREHRPELYILHIPLVVYIAERRVIIKLVRQSALWRIRHSTFDLSQRA